MLLRLDEEFNKLRQLETENRKLREQVIMLNMIFCILERNNVYLVKMCSFLFKNIII